jgi:hypothetical protein
MSKQSPASGVGMNNNRYFLVHSGGQRIENVSLINDGRTARAGRETNSKESRLRPETESYRGIEFLKPTGGKFHDRNAGESKARQRRLKISQLGVTESPSAASFRPLLANEIDREQFAGNGSERAAENAALKSRYCFGVKPRSSFR